MILHDVMMFRLDVFSDIPIFFRKLQAIHLGGSGTSMPPKCIGRGREFGELLGIELNVAHCSIFFGYEQNHVLCRRC